MKKIAFLFPYNTWGGAFRSTYELTNRLVAKGYDVDIIFPIWAPWEGERNIIRNFIWRIRSLARSLIRGRKVPWFSVKAQIKLIPRISSMHFLNYDHIIANHWNTAMPVHSLDVQAIKSFYIRDVEQWASYYSLELEAFKLPLNKIVVADWIQLFLFKQLGLSSTVITNGTNPDPFLVTKKKFKKNSPVISMIYATHPMKAMDFGYQVLSAVKKMRPEVAIRLFGFARPPESWSFVDEFIARPTGEKLRKVYADSDIFFCPSDQEGFHNPPREAMVAEAAVLATDVGCIPSLGLDRENMMVIAPRDEEQAVSKMIELIDSLELRLRLTASAKKTILASSWDSKVLEFEEFMRMLEK
jgi:glycosyltransferase involved in cell wall biosynthesis